MFVMKRKRLHRLLVGSMLAVIVLVSLVNPVMANQGKVKMIAYDHGHEGDPEVEIYKDVVEEFNRRTDVDATIEYRFIAGDAYYPRINAMIAANDAPDIFSSHAAGRLKRPSRQIQNGRVNSKRACSIMCLSMDKSTPCLLRSM